MNQNYFHRNNCRLCGSEQVSLVIKMDPIPLSEGYSHDQNSAKAAERYPLDVYMCSICGHVQQLDIVDSKILWDSYTYASGNAKGIPEHMRETAASIVLKANPERGSLVVDIGSNDGSLLKCFQELGLSVIGVDPSKEMAERANAAGVNTFNNFMSLNLAKEIKSKFGPADIVCAFNVFAHADNLDEMTESIRELLSENGLFFFEAQYLLDIIDGMLIATIFHEHMSHHSVKPLVEFFDRHGMELVSLKKAPIQHGSIVGEVQLKGGKRSIDRSVYEFLDIEKNRKLDKLETLLDFGNKISSLRKRTKDFVDQQVAEHKRIWAYGAARSAPTLITQFGLEGSIDFILDDHPQKIGKFSSGYGIPIVSTSELLSNNPDFVVILAWVHSDKIINSNLDYLERGGKFIVLCPEPRIVAKDGVIMI